MSAQQYRKRIYIRPLPERLINKIAAGEVVERPASVVKELVENSIDAGADRIEIEIEKSGTSCIRIVDNGSGIEADQIEVAFGRHATSKIAEFSDLDAISSYGFRGEALPSIASVSRLRMVSRPEVSDSGTEIVYEGGVLQSKQPCPAAIGTTIEVRDLFFNTPARRKFLKAETTEARHISRVVMALAMGRADIGFVFTLNGRQVFSRPAEESLRDRVTALLAPGKKLVEVAGEAGPVSVAGYIGTPEMVQSNRNGQYVFVNGRSIHSPTLSHALASGYGELLPRGNFPIGALLLTVNPQEIDVNVHPAKTEVRLSRERDIYSVLHHLVKDSLRQDGIIPTFRPSAHQPGAPGPFPGRSEGSPQSNVIPGIGQRAHSDSGFVSEMYRSVPTPQRPVSGEVVHVDTNTGEIIEPSAPVAPGPQSGDFRLVGRFGDLYLLFQGGESLFVIDQHTAHERVLFEETLRRMDDQGGTSQGMLIPAQVELNAEQMAIFGEAESLLNHSGFAVEHFGGTTVRIEGVPAILSKKGPEKSLLAILDDIASLKKSGYDLKKATAESIACRSAVMAGDRLSDEEAIALIDSLVKCENMYSCPHGRPTFIQITKSDLDRQFGRG